MLARQKMRPLWQFLGTTILAFSASGLFFVSLALGQMPTSLSVQAERTGSGGTAEAIYRVHLEAGDGGAAFGFEYELPSWPGSERLVGSPTVVTSVLMTGPGTLRPATIPPAPKPSPSLKKAPVCLRARSSRFGRAYWVEVPGNGNAVIEIKGRASYPGWPRTEYKLSFSTFASDSQAAERSPLQTVSTPPLGTKGVHISMQARNTGERRSKGMSPEIVGRTEPPLRLAHILLRAVRPSLSGSLGVSQWNSPSEVVLGGVRTDNRGRFRLAPEQFPFVGEYAVLAKSQARSGLSADWNCGPLF